MKKEWEKRTLNKKLISEDFLIKHNFYYFKFKHKWIDKKMINLKFNYSQQWPFFSNLKGVKLK